MVLSGLIRERTKVIINEQAISHLIRLSSILVLLGAGCISGYGVTAGACFPCPPGTYSPNGAANCYITQAGKPIRCLIN